MYIVTVWQCNSKFNHHCTTPTLDEENVKERFLGAYTQLIENRSQLIEDARLIQETLTDCTDIDLEIHTLGEELSEIATLIRQFIDQNASEAMNQGAYLERYNTLTQRHEKAYSRYQMLENRREERINKANQIGGFLFELMERDQPLVEFDNRLWLMVIDKVIAHPDGHLVYKFQNGMEVSN